MEKLSAHIILKEKISARKQRKLEAVYGQYLQKKEEEREEEHLRVFLKKRRDVVFEICTRLYEDERKRAEDTIIQVKKSLLLIIIMCDYKYCVIG